MKHLVSRKLSDFSDRPTRRNAEKWTGKANVDISYLIPGTKPEYKESNIVSHKKFKTRVGGD